MGALVDLSTVAVSAIGSFPVSFMQGNTEFKNRMDTAVKLIRNTNINVDGHATDNAVTVQNGVNNDTSNPMSEQDILDSLMPNSNSL